VLCSSILVSRLVLRFGSSSSTSSSQLGGYSILKKEKKVSRRKRRKARAGALVTHSMYLSISSSKKVLAVSSIPSNWGRVERESARVASSRRVASPKTHRRELPAETMSSSSDSEEKRRDSKRFQDCQFERDHASHRDPNDVNFPFLCPPDVIEDVQRVLSHAHSSVGTSRSVRVASSSVVEL
jgi:hypothetical protein